MASVFSFFALQPPSLLLLPIATETVSESILLFHVVRLMFLYRMFRL